MQRGLSRQSVRVEWRGVGLLRGQHVAAALGVQLLVQRGQRGRRVNGALCVFALEGVRQELDREKEQEEEEEEEQEEEEEEIRTGWRRKEAVNERRRR